MKKITFSLIVVLLTSVIISIIGYNEFIIRKDSQKYQEINNSNQEKETTTKEEEHITINCIGDSLTLGSSTNSFPTMLSSQTGYSVNKFGGSYDQTIDSAIRLGGVKVYVNNITIPSSPTPVSIDILDKDSQKLDVLKTTGSNFTNVEIDGIPGKLTYDQDSKTHTFTRIQKGDQKTITSLTQITAEYPEYSQDDIAIIFTGTYDSAIQNGVFRTITYQRSIIKQLKTKKYIVVSLTSKRRFPIVGDMNKVLEEEHGEHFLDFRTYLLENGLTDANITPTETDKNDLQKKYIPSSLLEEDKLNGNSYFNKLLAEQIIKKAKELNYIS